MKLLIPIFIVLSLLLSVSAALADDEKKESDNRKPTEIKAKVEPWISKYPPLSGQPLEWFEKARRRFDQKVFDDTIVYVNKVLDVAPRYVPAYYLRGLAFIEKGKRSRGSKDDADKRYNKYIYEYGKAVHNFTKVIEFDPENKDAYLNRGISYRNLDYYPDLALADLTKYIEEFGIETARSYTERGIILNQGGYIPEAMEDLKKAISMDYNYSDAYIDLMKSYDTLTTYGDAVIYFSLLATLYPDSAFPYYYRGVAYLKLGDKANASKDFRRALVIYPDFEGAKEMLEKSQ